MNGVPRYSRRLMLEAPERVPDAAGGWAQTWSELGMLWAELRAGTGREKADAFVTQSAVSYRIRVRAMPVGSPRRPRPEQRFRDETRVYRILAVADDDPSARYLTCYCSEEVLA